MRTYLYWVISVLWFTVAACCDAAEFKPIMVNCHILQSSAVNSMKQRVEIAASGFSFLPPQGEDWCYRPMASQGGSFFKIPDLDGDIPSQEKIGALHFLSAIAISLKGFRDVGTNIQSPDELKTIVNVLISEQLFPQIVDGVQSTEHRFRLLESNLTINSALGANCVRFDATVEERGSVQAPGLVFLLNFPGNLVCRHPEAPGSELIWIGFVERYVRGDQRALDAMKAEYEPFVQSLRFMALR